MRLDIAARNLDEFSLARLKVRAPYQKVYVQRLKERRGREEGRKAVEILSNYRERGNKERLVGDVTRKEESSLYSHKARSKMSVQIERLTINALITVSSRGKKRSKKEGEEKGMLLSSSFERT